MLLSLKVAILLPILFYTWIALVLFTDAEFTLPIAEYAWTKQKE